MITVSECPSCKGSILSDRTDCPSCGWYPGLYDPTELRRREQDLKKELGVDDRSDFDEAMKLRKSEPDSTSTEPVLVETVEQILLEGDYVQCVLDPHGGPLIRSLDIAEVEDLEDLARVLKSLQAIYDRAKQFSKG